MFADKQAVLNAFRFRHACKSYDAAKKIPADDFAYILETARLSPSSFGLEPWRFLVVQNPALREELRSIAWGAANKIMDCSHFVILLARTQAAMQADYQEKIWGGVHGMPSETVEMMQGFLTSLPKPILPLPIIRAHLTTGRPKTGRRGRHHLSLGYTKICLIVNEENSPLPVFDSTKIHTLAAVDETLAG